MKTRRLALDRTGDCTSCHLPIAWHYDGATNRFVGCAGAAHYRPSLREQLEASVEASGYLNARKAAAHVGYEPGVDEQGRPLPTSRDRAMRAFYEFARRHGIEKKRRGRRTLLFLKADLDRAIERCSREAHAPADRMQAMEDLARAHARGEVRH